MCVHAGVGSVGSVCVHAGVGSVGCVCVHAWFAGVAQFLFSAITPPCSRLCLHPQLGERGWLSLTPPAELSGQGGGRRQERTCSLGFWGSGSPMPTLHTQVGLE